jgi:hypothetical protein
LLLLLLLHHLLHVLYCTAFTAQQLHVCSPPAANGPCCHWQCCCCEGYSPQGAVPGTKCCQQEVLEVGWQAILQQSEGIDALQEAKQQQTISSRECTQQDGIRQARTQKAHAAKSRKSAQHT